VTTPFEPPFDDSPIDPNPQYPSPPPSAGYSLPPGAPAPPPPGYPGSSGAAPWYDDRPPAIPAAGVLAYVDAGLLILAGLLLMVGASAVDSWNNAFGSHDNSITAELAIDGLINMVAAGLQISGGIMIAGRSEGGRVLLTVGGGLCIAAGLYWVLRVHDVGVVIWAIVFVTLPIVGLSLAWSPAATDWLRGKTPP
jgi:hypothetical protein